jgi:Flp pilus assembly protein TadB
MGWMLAALTIGAGFIGYRYQIPLYWATAGWVFGWLFHPAPIALNALIEGLGLDAYVWFRQRERVYETQEQQAALLLERLAQLLPVRGSLTAALDALGFRGHDSVSVLKNLAYTYQTDAVYALYRVVQATHDQGGNLLAVLDLAYRTLEEQRHRRYARQLELAPQQSTVVVLSLAPFVVWTVFRIVMTPFYTALIQSAIGRAAVLAQAGLQTGVWAFLLFHMYHTLPTAARPPKSWDNAVPSPKLTPTHPGLH